MHKVLSVNKVFSAVTNCLRTMSFQYYHNETIRAAQELKQQDNELTRIELKKLNWKRYKKVEGTNVSFTVVLFSKEEKFPKMSRNFHLQ